MSRDACRKRMKGRQDPLGIGRGGGGEPDPPGVNQKDRVNQGVRDAQDPLGMSRGEGV